LADPTGNAPEIDGMVIAEGHAEIGTYYIRFRSAAPMTHDLMGKVKGIIKTVKFGRFFY